MKLTVEIEQQFKNHALTTYPNECCGMIISGKYVKIENVADEPLINFEISKKDSIKRYSAILHSHTYALNQNIEIFPSGIDIKYQITTDTPWFLVSTNGEDVSHVIGFGDFTLDDPLENREFIHGIYDCYSAIRAWYWQKFKIKLRDYPRDNLWWREQNKDLYVENFKKENFYEIDICELQYGDGVLMSVLSDKINHAAIYLGNNLIYHHLFNRKSKTDLFNRWRNYIAKAVRLKR